jgi:dethiobiotin synthetase
LKTKGLTILGTDTDVGKTFVACRIIESMVRQGLRVAAYKPVASGAASLEQSDAFKLWQATGELGRLDEVCPQSFATPLAPPIAAELEGKQVSDPLIRDGAGAWLGRCDILIVEGAGGLLSPMSWSMTNATLAQELQFPVVLVSENRLGVVNQVLTTLIAARTLGLHVCCVVLNFVRPDQSTSTESNLRMIETFLKPHRDPPRLSVLPYQSTDFAPPLNWFELGDYA